MEGIEARLSYTFATDAPASSATVRGWYQVTSELAAGELLRERVEVVPRTAFGPAAFEEEGASLGLELALPVDRRAFLARLEAIAAETGVPVGDDPTVTYTARVEVRATGPQRETRQILEPALAVPLTGDTFSISGDRDVADNGVIRRSEERPRPGVGARRRNTLVASGLVALLAPLFALATVSGPRRQPSTENALARQARSIRRKYRKRLAQVLPPEGPASPALPGAEVVPLGRMDDLARVSEELLKPIVYRGPVAPDHAHLFYVVDGVTRYEFELGAA